MKDSRKGLVIIVVISFLLIITLLAWAIVEMGCGEIIQSRVRNDLVSAFYVASAGAETLYATLRTQSNVIWGQAASGSVSQSGYSIGNFSAVTNILSSDEFYIASEGTVNNRKAKVIVKFGYSSDFTGGVPLGSIGPMILEGASQLAKLRIEGPAMSNSTITLVDSVQVTNGTLPNLSMPIPDFWCDAYMNPKIKFDTNNDGNYVTDTNSDGVVTLAEAQVQGKEDIFNADNVYTTIQDLNGDGIIGADESANLSEINDRDAFFYYYTVDLDTRYDLDIAPGEANYYSAEQSFEAGDVATDVRVIFIDGSVAIDQNDQAWVGIGNATLNHTIAAVGDISIIQPTNRPGDVLTIVSCHDVYTTGTMGNQGGILGDLIIYANNNFTADNGGKANGSIFAGGTVTIDTIGDDQGRDHRMLNRSTIDWNDEADRPIGLPKNYGLISLDFSIENESTHKSVWQRN